MVKLKLGAFPDDKPVKVSLELPAAVHRDLVAYADNQPHPAPRYRRVTSRKPEMLTVEFTPAQKQLHDDLLAVIARILRYAHGQQNVALATTTIRRQAASCL